jgi:hypothetical protein
VFLCKPPLSPPRRQPKGLLMKRHPEGSEGTLAIALLFRHPEPQGEGSLSGCLAIARQDRVGRGSLAIARHDEVKNFFETASESKATCFNCNSTYSGRRFQRLMLCPLDRRLGR